MFHLRQPLAKKIARSLAIALGMLVIGCRTPAPHSAPENTSESSSVTEKNAVAGKWLFTLTVAQGVPSSQAVGLEKVAERLLSREHGNEYRRLGLTDLSKPVSKAALKAMFLQLREEMTQFRATHAQAPAMLFMTIAAHPHPLGSEHYAFELSGGEFMSGTELIDEFKTTGASEIILLLQSCNSGNLATVDFPAKYFENLALAAGEKQQIAVIVPVNEKIKSIPMEWEQTILEPSLNDEGITGDALTYSAWKGRIRRLACSHPLFMPRALWEDPDNFLQKDLDRASGVDPQFFDSVSPNLPILLSKPGLSRWRAGALRLPPLQPAKTNPPGEGSSESYCQQRIRQEYGFWRQSLDSLNASYRSEQDPRLRLKIVAAIGMRRDPPSARARVLSEFFALEKDKAVADRIRRELRFLADAP